MDINNKTKVLTDAEIKKYIEEIRMSHQMEGYTLTEEDEKRLIDIAKGKTTPEQELEKRIKELKDKGVIK